MNIMLEIPESIIRKLEERADLEDKPLEESILEILTSECGLDDSETRFKIHLKLSKKYQSEGNNFLSNKDYIQAGEKFWGAAAQMIKAIAAKRKERLRSHIQLNEYLEKLCEEINDPELDRFWKSAMALHQNFYESWLPLRSVERGIEDVKRLIEKLNNINCAKESKGEYQEEC